MLGPKIAGMADETIIEIVIRDRKTNEIVKTIGDLDSVVCLFCKDDKTGKIAFGTKKAIFYLLCKSPIMTRQIAKGMGMIKEVNAFFSDLVSEIESK